MGTNRSIIGRLKGKIARDRAADIMKQQRNGSVQRKPLREQEEPSARGRERSQGTGAPGKRADKKLG